MDPHRTITKQAATDQIGDRLRGKAPDCHVSAARFELLNHTLSQIDPFVGSDDSIVRRADIEDYGVVARRPDAFDHAVDLALDRIEQLPLPACRSLLQLLGPLLQLLLLPLQVFPFGGTLRRTQHDRLLVEI